MTTAKELEIQEKKELQAKGETTSPARYYVPSTDIYETEDALVVVMEIPGINSAAIDIRLDKDELAVSAEIDLANYARYKPVYREYNVGHFTRKFALSNKVDRDSIEATVADGVLSLKLPKAEEVKARRITVN